MCEYNDDDDIAQVIVMFPVFPVCCLGFSRFFSDKFCFFVKKNTHQSEKHDKKERIFFFFFFKFLVILFCKRKKKENLIFVQEKTVDGAFKEEISRRDFLFLFEKEEEKKR